MSAALQLPSAPAVLRRPLALLTPFDLSRTWSAYLRDHALALRDKLVDHYNSPRPGPNIVRVVRRAVVPHMPCNVPAADVIQAGRLRLIRAVEMYDPSRAVTFEVYASAMIRGGILEYLRKDDWVPRSVRSRIRHMEWVERQLEMGGNPAPTDADRAAFLGMSLDEFYEDRKRTRLACMVSLEEEVGSAEDQAPQPVLDALADRTSPGLFERAVAHSAAEALHALIARLPSEPRPVRYVVEQAYFHRKTQEALGVELGKSAAWVSQVHLEGLRLLREWISGGGMMDLFLAGTAGQRL